MNREELLDKLAMELPEWASVDCKDFDSIVPRLGVPYSVAEWRRHGTLFFVLLKETGKCITEINWRNRRREIISEPDYKDAPNWAKWVAQEKNGAWFWHSEKPDLSKHCWLARGSFEFSDVGGFPAGHRWQDTLRKVERKACSQDDVKQAESTVVASNKGCWLSDLATQLSEASRKWSEKYPGLTAEPSKQDLISHHIKKANKHFRKAHEHLEELMKIARELGE